MSDKKVFDTFSHLAQAKRSRNTNLCIITPDNVEHMLENLHSGRYSKQVVQSIEALTSFFEQWLTNNAENLENGYFAVTAAEPAPPTKTEFFYRAIHLVTQGTDGKVVYSLIAEVFVPKAQCVGEISGKKADFISRVLKLALPLEVRVSARYLRELSASIPVKEE